MGKPSALLWHAVCSEGQRQIEHFCNFQQPRGAQPLGATVLDKLILLPVIRGQFFSPTNNLRLCTQSVICGVSRCQKKGVLEGILAGWLVSTRNSLAEMFPETSGVCALHRLMLGLLLYMEW